MVIARRGWVLGFLVLACMVVTGLGCQPYVHVYETPDVTGRGNDSELQKTPFVTSEPRYMPLTFDKFDMEARGSRRSVRVEVQGLVIEPLTVTQRRNGASVLVGVSNTSDKRFYVAPGPMTLEVVGRGNKTLTYSSVDMSIRKRENDRLLRIGRFREGAFKPGLDIDLAEKTEIREDRIVVFPGDIMEFGVSWREVKTFREGTFTFAVEEESGENEIALDFDVIYLTRFRPAHY